MRNSLFKLNRQFFSRCFRRSFFLLGLGGSCGISAAQAQFELTIGANLSFDFQPYKGRSVEWGVLPSVFFDQDLWYAEGDEFGLYLRDDANNQLRLNVYYDGHAYRPSAELKALHARKWSVMAGASYMRITPLGALKLQLAQDVLARSRGAVASLAYLALLETGPWTFVPELGLQWRNARYNHYYFGVSAAESNWVGIAAYQPGQSVQPYASLVLDYRLNQHWDVYAMLSVDYLSQAQFRSPMVDTRFAVEPSLGVNYRF